MTADSRKLSALSIFQEGTLNENLPSDLFLDFRLVGLEESPERVELLSVTVADQVLSANLRVNGTDLLSITGPKQEEGILVSNGTGGWHAHATLGKGGTDILASITFSGVVPKFRNCFLTSAVGNFIRHVETPEGNVTGAVKVKALAGCRVSQQGNTVYTALDPAYGRACDTLRCNGKVFKLFGVTPSAEGDVKITSGNGLVVLPFKDTHSIDIKTIVTDECDVE